MNVPFIDLRRFESGFQERWLEACRSISENTAFVGGPEVIALESELATATGCAHAVGCANGTDALQLALRALGVGPGDVVLIPDATFWATFEAVINCGARPVTIDIDRADLQMDFDLFRKAVDDLSPRAAILVHLYGWGSAHLDDFRAFCRERGLPLLEDGAQAFGTRWRGESIFADAEVATLSFYPAKVLGACGDAGAVLTGNEELAATMRRLGNHGRTSHYEHGEVGWNSRMGGFEAAYLRLSLEHIDQRLGSRRRLAERYRQQVEEEGIEVRAAPPGYEENGYLNVSLLPAETRGTVHQALHEQGIGFGTVYPGAMSRQPGAEPWQAGRVGGENAHWLSESILNLPLFAYMKDEEQDQVLAVLAEALRAAATR